MTLLFSVQIARGCATTKLAAPKQSHLSPLELTFTEMADVLGYSLSQRTQNRL